MGNWSGKWFGIAWVIVGIGVCCVESRAAVAWDEAVNGDLSGDRLVPTSVVLAGGTNSLSGMTEAGDIDYVSVKVLPGQEFSQLVLQDYSGEDFTAFIAVQAGPTFTAAPPAPPVSSLLGYSHFGPGASIGARVGDDLMYALGTAGGAIGFSAPLPSGDYTFWIQQTGAATDYQFDFVVTVPEPATALTLMCGLALPAISFRRRQR